jgi:hypothetical protein
MAPRASLDHREHRVLRVPPERPVQQARWASKDLQARKGLKAPKEHPALQG